MVALPEERHTPSSLLSERPRKRRPPMAVAAPWGKPDRCGVSEKVVVHFSLGRDPNTLLACCVSLIAAHARKVFNFLLRQAGLSVWDVDPTPTNNGA